MIVYGTNVVRELINSNTRINKIIYSTNRADVSELVALAERKGIKTERNTDKTENGQGIMADIPNFKYCEISDILNFANNKNQVPFILVLDGIQDPHNLGALIRTAECAGVHGIIIPTNRATDITDTVYKTSAGASYIQLAGKHF